MRLSKIISTKDRIIENLKDSFTILDLEVIDVSHKHVGHHKVPGTSTGHFSVLIVSPDFEGKKSVERHRLIYEALKKEFKKEVHALAIKAFTPTEITL